MMSVIELRVRIEPWDDRGFVQAFESARDQVRAEGLTINGPVALDPRRRVAGRANQRLGAGGGIGAVDREALGPDLIPSGFEGLDEAAIIPRLDPDPELDDGHLASPPRGTVRLVCDFRRGRMARF